MLKGFRDFILRGNVLDLAVGVIIGGAFGTVVTSLVKDVFTPFIGNLVGKPDFSAIQYNHVMIGNFLNAVIAFLLVAVAVYFFIVVPGQRTDGPFPQAGARCAAGDKSRARSASATFLLPPSAAHIAPSRLPDLSLRAASPVRAAAVRTQRTPQTTAAPRPPSSPAHGLYRCGAKVRPPPARRSAASPESL